MSDGIESESTDPKWKPVAERMVQVPVSLIRRVLLMLHGPYAGLTAEELRALLSQPTPTSEPFRPAPDEWFTFGSHVGFDGPLVFSDETDEVGDPLWERHPEQLATPPSIADMVPGTTFTEDVRWTVTGTLSTGVVVAHSDSGEMRFADRFDPSTIRDVTLPKEPS